MRSKFIDTVESAEWRQVAFRARNVNELFPPCLGLDHGEHCLVLRNCHDKVKAPIWQLVPTPSAIGHEAIFLATCNATMKNKTPFKLQRGCYTFGLFSQLATLTITNKIADALRRRNLAKDEL